MGRPDYIFGQFRETARCRDAQHGDGVCCAFAPQLVTAQCTLVQMRGLGIACRPSVCLSVCLSVCDVSGL